MKKTLPDFSKMTEDEIADFWDTHSFVDYWDQLEDVDEEFVDKRPMRSISMRIDEKTLKDLKKVAKEKGLGYQTLIRFWVKEMLRKEAS